MSLPIQAANLVKLGLLHQETHSAGEIEDCLHLANQGKSDPARASRAPGSREDRGRILYIF